MLAEPVFKLDAISKSFGPTLALDELSLSIEAGETLVLIGPSGCGKSSLLRLLNGLIRCDAGRVEFEGTEIRDDNVRTLRRRMGYVIQEGGLFPHLTAKRTVSLMAGQLGGPAQRVDERLVELCELTKLPLATLHRYPSELSGGQRQRVSLMRALMLDPDVLLMDEPLGALDPMIRAELQAQLRNIFRALRKTVVLVTHDLHEAGYFGDDIVLLRQGRLVQRGTLQELLEAPKDDFVRAFVRAQRALFDAPQVGALE